MDIDAVYMAGFFDGEGYIGLIKRQKGKYTEYIITLSIGQNDGGTMDWIKSNFGGHLHKVKRDGSYYWITTNRAAYKILQRITPFLKYKRPQAELALSFYDNLVQGSRVSEIEKERREDIYLKLKQAKRIFKQSLLCTSRAGATTKREHSVKGDAIV